MAPASRALGCLLALLALNNRAFGSQIELSRPAWPTRWAFVLGLGVDRSALSGALGCRDGAVNAVLQCLHVAQDMQERPGTAGGTSPQLTPPLHTALINPRATCHNQPSRAALCWKAAACARSTYHCRRTADPGA
jgi:hypothetical protein